MKSYTVILTPRAERQIGELYAFIADRSGVERAEGFVGRIIADCMSLSTFPERGIRRDDIRPNLRIEGFVARH